MSDGYTLVEMLVSIAIAIVLAAMLLVSVAKAYRTCKAWAWGVYAHSENRMNAFLDDSREAERWQMYYATNKPMKWSFINENGAN